MRSKLPIRRRWRLHTSGDLNGYLFTDSEHARRWLAQRFVNDRDYGVSLVLAKEKWDGDDRILRVILRRFKPSDFLARPFLEVLLLAKE